MSHISRICTAGLLTVLLLLSVAADSAAGTEPGTPQQPRNVIFFIGDGMGPAYVKAYRVFADNPATPGIDPLALDSILVGAVATDSISESCDDAEPPNCVLNPYGVTDSASSATAYASGFDTLDGRVGADLQGQPLTSVLEQAARQGKGTGVVSTSQITHASPAAFIAHADSRGDYAHIADQFFDNQVDGKPLAQVILGGGVRDFRRDDRDISKQLEAAGYRSVDNRAALLEADTLPLLGLFAPVGLPRHWDRPETTPSLADMTGKAIELLAADEQGFFLMVEGSQIDWAGHGNDIAGVISEMEGFVEAIQRALAFAQQRDDTLVVITADHETGGLSIGRDGVYAWNPLPLRSMTSTPAAVSLQFMADADASLADLFQAAAGFELSEAERQVLSASPRDADEAYAAMTDILNERTLSGWTSTGHTGVDVPLYATGPGSEAFSGVLQNQQLGQLLWQAVTGATPARP
jgi:alkaline phosphatase